MAGKKIIALTYWSYKDALIQTYTLPYLKMISQAIGVDGTIYLLTLEQAHLRMSVEEKEEAKRMLGDLNIKLIAWPYAPFGFAGALRWMVYIFRLYGIIVSRGIGTIHAFCTPAGMIGHMLSVMTAKDLVLDSYEPHAESMVENGTWKEGSFVHRLLFSYERKQSKRAKAVIGTVAAMKDYAQERYNTTIREFYSKPACVDLEMFSTLNNADEELRKSLGLDGKVVCVYAGKLGGIYLDEEIFDIYKACFEVWGDRFRVLMLSNTPSKQLDSLAVKVGLDPKMIISRFVPFAEMPKYLRLADFAINPVKPVPTKKYCTSIKDGEYWAMGLPVMIPANISEDSALIKESGYGVVLKDLDKESIRDAVSEMKELLSQDREELARKVRELAVEHRSFSIAESIYKKIYA
ncbi:MAG: hypothetical protein IH946_00075 [Bacteroidetes bacterium]|nr:hypothetical protein [Bacteroidota bacterium]